MKTHPIRAYKISGQVIALWGLLLPLMFLLVSFFFQTVSLAHRKIQIDHLALQSAQSGVVVVFDALQKQAEKNYKQQCNVLEPPSICTSQNIFDFLPEEEIKSVIYSSVEEVVNAVKNFALKYDPQKTIKPENIFVIFPSDFHHNPSSCSVVLEVVLQENRTRFIALLNQSSQRVLGRVFLEITLQ